MSIGRIVGVFEERDMVAMAVRVEGDSVVADGLGGGVSVAVEYIGYVKNDNEFQALSVGEKTARLLEAVRAVRGVNKPTPSVILPQFRGNVTV